MDKLDVTELMLYQYVPQAEARMLEQFPAMTAHAFSPRARRRMRKLLRITENPKSVTYGGRSIRFLLAVALAAIILAAGYYSISDAFREVLKEQNQAGEIVPVASLSPLADKSGTVVKQTQKSGDVDVTLRGVVYDDAAFKILVDVTSPAGTPLAAKDADGNPYSGQRSFQKMRLIINPDTPEEIEDDIASIMELGERNPSTATIAFDGINEGLGDVKGKPARLELSNLLQFVPDKGDSMGIPAANLYEVSKLLPPPEPDAYFTHGGAGGNAIYHRKERATKSIAFSTLYPDLRLDSIWLDQERLYFTGEMSQDTAKSIGDLILEDLRTGKICKASGMAQSWSSEQDADGTPWNSWGGVMKVPGITSMEQLQNYSIVCHAEELMIAEETWQFDFILDNTAPTRTIKKNAAFTVNYEAYQLEELTISPISMRVLAMPKVDLRGVRRSQLPRKPKRQAGETDLTLTMKDGSTTSVVGSSGSEEEETGNWMLYYEFQALVDPEQVQSVQLGDLTILLEE